MAAWGPNTLLDMAMLFSMKSFVSHKHCQSLMDVWYRGGFPGGKLILDDDVSMLTILLYVLCPPCNPYMSRPPHIPWPALPTIPPSSPDFPW